MSQQLNVRLDDALLAELKAAAASAGETTTAYIKTALRMRLDVPRETIHKPTERVAHTPIAVVDGIVQPPTCDHALWNRWSAACPTCKEKLR